MFMFNSCSNYDCKISELKQEKLRFAELPIEVKEFLLHPPEFDIENPGSLILIDSAEEERYKLEVKFNKWVSSWVDYVKLIDTKSKTSYRIKQGVPDPYIVFDNKLYIPDRYGIVVVNNNLEEVEFTCYQLK